MKNTIATPVGLDIPYEFTSQLPPKRKGESVSDFNTRKDVFSAAKARTEQKEADRLEELAKYGDHEFTAAQITQWEKAQVKAEAAAAISDQLQARKQALADKWKTPFDLLDDILERGIDAVKIDRDAIKAANPKPVE